VRETITVPSIRMVGVSGPVKISRFMGAGARGARAPIVSVTSVGFPRDGGREVSQGEAAQCSTVTLGPR